MKNIKVLVSVVLCMILAFAFSFPKAAQDMNREQLEKRFEEVKEYLVLDGTWLYFDLEKAERAGVSKEVLEMGLDLEEVSTHLNKASLRGETLAVALSGIPIYGNYCGPWYSGDDFTLPAIDVLDEGCRQHDLCYKGPGLGVNCECNKALVSYIYTHWNEMSEAEQKVAKLIAFFFASFGLVGCI